MSYLPWLEAPCHLYLSIARISLDGFIFFPRAHENREKGQEAQDGYRHTECTGLDKGVVTGEAVLGNNQ